MTGMYLVFNIQDHMGWKLELLQCIAHTSFRAISIEASIKTSENLTNITVQEIDIHMYICMWSFL